MTETPQNPALSLNVIAFDPPPPWQKHIDGWQKTVQIAVDGIARDVRLRVVAFHAIGREAHRAVHQMGWLGAFQRNRRGLRLRGMRRKRRLAFVRCDTCHPNASPKPLPHGLGTAYAARRRHR